MQKPLAAKPQTRSWPQMAGTSSAMGATAHEPVPPMRWMLPLEKSMGGCLAGRPVHQVPEGWMPLSTRFSFLANTQDDQGADMELMKPMVR